MQHLTITERTISGVTERISDITCVVCNGKKTVSKKVLAEVKAEIEMWCTRTCGRTPDEDLTFYDDGEHPEIHKHHWRCRRCGKIVQIG